MYSQQEITALQQSMQDLQQGRFEPARKRLKELRKSHPDNAEALHLLGLVTFQTGQTEEGLTQVRRAASLLPDAAHIRNNLANLLMSLNQVDEARENYLEAIRINPAQGDAYLNLGNIYRLAGQLREALDAYQQAAKLIPSHPGILFSLGVVQAAFGEAGPAEVSFRQALTLEPNAADVWFRLGELCLDQNRLEEAWTCFQNVIRRQPEHAPSHNSLGNIFFLKGQLDQAERFYQLALQFKPDFAEAANNMGFVCYQREDYAAAETWVRKALSLKPDYAQAWENLASVYRKLEDMPAAEAAYRRAAELGNRPELLVKSALMLPGIYDSSAEMQSWRARLEKNLDHLLVSDIRLEDPSHEVGEMPFYLHYYGGSWLDLAKKLGAFYRQACPALVWTAPHCGTKKPPGARLRVGVVSQNLRDHAMAKLFGAVVGRLDRGRFEVSVCSDRAPGDAVARAIAAEAHAWLVMPAELYAARDFIAEQRFDILFYPEIATDPLPYFLAYARLAPLQVTTWGFGSSTGLPEVDVFFSSQDLETEVSRRDYSERLIECEHLMPCFKRPPYAGRLRSRADFGLPEGPLYGCLQSLFKLHPDFDPFLRRLLEADEKAHLVLIEGHFGSWTDKVKARLSRNLGPAYARIHFAPRMPETEFLQLAGCCDVLLDPWPICGGNSSYELLCTGRPLVTLTGPFGKNRITHAVFCQIGFTETVTETPDAYFELAHALAHDPAAQARIQGEILSRLDLLYERPEGIHEFGQALYQAYYES